MSAFTVSSLFHPETPCDRCSHPLRRHAGPERASRCLVWSQAKDPHDPRTCLCDGYVPAPAQVLEEVIAKT